MPTSPMLMWDASGLAKRYVSEPGSKTVNALFSMNLSSPMVVTLIGYAETYSILRRRFNAGLFTARDYSISISALRLEVVESLTFQFLETDPSVFDSIPLIERHNINATDAAILASYLALRDSSSTDGQQCVLVAADHRLLRAARAEGLPAIDPEALSPREALAFFEEL